MMTRAYGKTPATPSGLLHATATIRDWWTINLPITPCTTARCPKRQRGDSAWTARRRRKSRSATWRRL